MVMGNLPESTEVAVLGAGPGGYVAAIRLAQLGKDVVLISEEENPGGTCLQRGCIPSKAMIELAHLLTKSRQASELGLSFGEAQVDLQQWQAWKTKLLTQLSRGISQLLQQYGIQYIVGKARFLTAHELEIQSKASRQKFQFEQCIIATGSSPQTLKDFPWDPERILSSTEILQLEKIPESLIVIGGGYIGLELGSALSALGTKVTVVEASPQLLPGLDPDLLRPVKKKLEAKGVKIYLNTIATSPQKKDGNIEVSLKSDSADAEKISAEYVLVAVGRQARTQELGLEDIGVRCTPQGFIETNSQCQSSLSNIYAIGDAAGGMMLAHKASAEAKVAAGHIAGEKTAFDAVIPAVVFTDPEIAYVGLQASQTEAQGLEISTGLFSFAALGRAQTLGEPEGFVKVVAEKSSGRILGVQIVGPHASDLISEATLAIEMGAFLDDIARVIHPHPSLPEAFQEACESALGISIHRFDRAAKLRHENSKK